MTPLEALIASLERQAVIFKIMRKRHKKLRQEKWAFIYHGMYEATTHALHLAQFTDAATRAGSDEAARLVNARARR